MADPGAKLPENVDGPYFVDDACTACESCVDEAPNNFKMNDDDEYASPYVIENLVKLSKRDHVNVGRVERWNKTVWPKNWRNQKSFQTECYFLHTDHKLKAKWWGNKGGDHNYSKQLTKVLPINWIEKLLICKAQEGKGHGRRLDKNGKRPDYSKYKKQHIKKMTCLNFFVS